MPTVTAVAPATPAIAAGAGLGFAAAPSWPEPLSPQHASVPSFLSAHTFDALLAIDAASVRPVTATGVRCCCVVPSPSWPRVLLPQHTTVASFLSAHDDDAPSATCVASVSCATATGARALVTVPSPS